MLEYDTDNDNLKTSRIRSYRYKKLGVWSQIESII